MTPHTLPMIDVDQSAIANWRTYTSEDRLQWSLFFGLRAVDYSSINTCRPYTHAYSYRLTDDDVARIVFCAVVEIVRYNKSNGMQRAYIGNSGGLDSATTIGLLSKAVQLSQALESRFEVVSYGLPIVSNPDHNKRATETAQAFGIEHITVDGLDTVLHDYQTVLSPLADRYSFTDEERRRSFGNVKARMRMIVNFFGTTQSGSYVVSTDNLSELYMAFWTLMGDVGAFGPIQNILKGLELPAVAYALGVPLATLGAKPTDGLEVHKSLDELEGGDTDAFGGIQYPHLDAIICHATKAGFDLTQIKTVSVDATTIASSAATQEVVDHLVATMASPAAVWKRTKGSIGSALSREELGLPPVAAVAELL